ncbi:MAG TPA: AMP-binding protein [Stellaceae bacterium]|nr:AMP-binding protein [Stellaceae bacterium]
MEIALTPMEFARRARRLYAEREAVVDGTLRLSYAQFLERCDRWSSALQALGVRQGDRVAYIAPNTHSHLEAYYAVPQIGAVLVPINYRLVPDDFAYIINHCGAKIVCVHADYLEAVDSIRETLKGVAHFVALEGAKGGWIDYESTLAVHAPDFATVAIAENDLLTINYTSGTTARPKGVMITHRNAYMNVMGTLAHHHLTPGDRYLWTLPMFHANGWTFVWINTARGMAHVCLRRVEPRLIFQLIKDENITMVTAQVGYRTSVPIRRARSASLRGGGGIGVNCD